MYREPARPADAVDLQEVDARAWWESADDRAARFLGPRAVLDATGYVGLDGTRRIRFGADDDRARFEVLDPASGVTLSSHVATSRLERPEIAPRPVRRVWHAPVLGRAVRQVCFVGRPRQLGGAPRAVDARMVRLLELDEGALVVRVDAEGQAIADTLHASPEAAARQLEHELGPHVGTLRRGERGRPFRRRSGWVGVRGPSHGV